MTVQKKGTCGRVHDPLLEAAEAEVDVCGRDRAFGHLASIDAGVPRVPERELFVPCQESTQSIPLMLDADTRLASLRVETLLLNAVCQVRVDDLAR